MPQGVFYFFGALVVVSSFSLNDGVVTSGIWFFVLPGVAFALMPALLFYSIVGFAFVGLNRCFRLTTPLRLLAGAVIVTLAVLPNWHGKRAFDAFTKLTVSGDFSNPVGPRPRVVALDNFLPAPWCDEQCQELLISGVEEVWMGTRDSRTRFRMEHRHDCPTARRLSRKLPGACVDKIGAAQGIADVVIASRSMPIDPSYAQDKRNRWRWWTVAKVERFEVFERSGASLRLVERRTFVEGRVAGWPSLTLPTMGPLEIRDFYTAVNRNVTIVNPTTAVRIVRSRYGLEPPARY